MNKNVLELGLFIHYNTGVEQISESGQVWKEGVSCKENSYKISTDTDKGAELLGILKQIYSFNKIHLSATTFGRIPESSAYMSYTSFKKTFKEYSDFKKMLKDMNAEYLEKNVDVDAVCIAFKPLNMVESVDYGWTSIEQYLNGEIGVRPNDRQ